MKALSTQIDPSELLVKNLNLVIIGCGDPSLIKFYAKETEAKYPIFADPSQDLFKKFGLARTVSAGKKPDYIPYGYWAGFRVFFATLAKAGKSALKAGDVKQVGGEYYLLNEFTDDVRFLLGPGLKCTWGHRMSTTRDHTEIVELRKVVGLSQKTTPDVHEQNEEGRAAAVKVAFGDPRRLLNRYVNMKVRRNVHGVCQGILVIFEINFIISKACQTSLFYIFHPRSSKTI